MLKAVYIVHLCMYILISRIKSKSKTKPRTVVRVKCA